MSTAYFALYKGKQRLSSRFLAWWQRSDYSHCERVLSLIGNRAYCGSSSFLDGGVRRKWIDLNPQHWEVWAIDARPGGAGEWFIDHDGERYDLPGLLGFVFRRVKGFLRAWWCSEAVTASDGWVDPWRFDVATLAAVLKTFGRPVPLPAAQG